ncbi:hypothetical protein [Streptomyces zagrosensis]|uniref:Integral membrane protein n=1 Tax=Streptomyces zagrosensis TaxID=1042984 RepID=A0A7W9V1H0_9ACTN|nr:hypothetical protein [Streptomyces zagrosensis]MBB5937784.1 hypothetical protein [Streptomyces zagrosensis]
MLATDELNDEALYVLTAVLVTPAQFPSVLGDDYPQVCAVLGLAPHLDGYGLVLGQDGAGARWTVVTDDVSLVACAVAAWDCGLAYDLSPGERTIVAALPGWPLAVAVAAPGIPAPHDPPPEPGPDGLTRQPLSPPDCDRWGPAQRRLGADEIALQWVMWRQQVDGAAMFAEGGTASQAQPAVVARVSAGPSSAIALGHAAPSTDRRPPATPAAAGPHGDGPGHAGVRRVLREAHDYVRTPPPPGRVRSAYASGQARTLRADGPGWSLVARTDDIAFVLLDDEPGEVLPVGRGAELPGLLAALDALAVRPE